MDVLGPRMRRGVVRVAAPGMGRMPLLPSATRRPPAIWKVRDAFLVLGAGLLFLLVAGVVSLGLAQLQSVDMQTRDARAAIGAGVGAGFYLFLLYMIRSSVVVRYRLRWSALGLRTAGWQWIATVPLALATLIFADVLYLKAMVAVLGPRRTWPAQLNPSTVDAAQMPVLSVLVLITGLLLTPLVEELLFRGVLYQALRRRMPIGTAALVSAMVFALMHGQVVLFIPFTVMGVLLALVYERSGSLIPTILIHGCNNGLILLFYTISQR